MGGIDIARAVLTEGTEAMIAQWHRCPRGPCLSAVCVSFIHTPLVQTSDMATQMVREAGKFPGKPGQSGEKGTVMFSKYNLFPLIIPLPPGGIRNPSEEGPGRLSE